MGRVKRVRANDILMGLARDISLVQVPNAEDRHTVEAEMLRR
jgi:hypothetical protein